MRKMKRYASFALAACMSLSLLVNSPAGKAFAAEMETREDTVLEQTETAVEDAVETSEADFEWDGTIIKKYMGKGGAVVIPSKCTEIGSGAFDASKNENCKNLISVVIPDGVTTIRDAAFNECSGLVSVTIPESVTQMTGGIFFGCSSLTSVKLPSGITRIGNYTFYRCSQLTSIEIPVGVTQIGWDAFAKSGLTSIEIPAGVSSVGTNAFWDCKDLMSVKIPASVTSIRDTVFSGCDNLESIVIDPENKTYSSYGGCNAVIETETNKLIHGCKNTKIPSGVTSIGDYALKNCSQLTSLEIPASVISIGVGAFEGCNLKSIQGTQGSYAETYAKAHRYQFIDMTVPTVTNVKAAAAGKNKVKVTWDKVSGATGYIVYARKSGTYAKLGVTAVTSYTDTKALDNDYNFYFVYAYKKTAAGNILTGKCQKYAYAKGTCMAVTNLKASSVKGGVKLTWTKSAGADGYIVYGKKTNFKYGYIGMTSKNTATSYTDTKADKKDYNFYWVFPYHYDKNGKRVIGPISKYVFGKAK